MSDYSDETGEPLQYEGFVHSGSDSYLFTIESNEEVVWQSIAPPTNATHIPIVYNTTSMVTKSPTDACDCNDDDGSSQTENSSKDGVPMFVWILVIIILIMTNVLFVVLWMRARKT